MQLPSIKAASLAGKTVLLRFDGDVPVDSGGTVQDGYRLEAIKETFHFCLDQGERIVLLAHRGRPTLPAPEQELSNRILLKPLEELLGVSIAFAENVPPHSVPGAVTLVENLRFTHGEEANSPRLARSLAELGDIYCNDAFAVSHRTHASIVGLPALLPHYGGLHLLEEVRSLSLLLGEVDEPYGVVLGGAKASDKFPVLEQFVTKADLVIVGGLVALPYLAAMGYRVGAHKIANEDVKLACRHIRLIQEAGITFLTPVDFISAKHEAKPITQFAANDLMLDIGPKSISLYKQALDKANAVFWNGAMGKFEEPAFSRGTIEVARAIGTSGSGVRIASGGDTVSAIHDHKLAHNFTFISSGGGASLEFVAGRELPGLNALHKT